MAPTVSREAAITTAVVAVASSAVVVGYLYREKTQEVARSTYAAVSAQASAAATKGSEVAKGLQSTVVASCKSVATSANSAWESVTASLKKAKSQRSLRRVRSFPIVAEDDVAAGKDQKKEKRAKAVKKATQEAMGVPVQVMAK